MIFYLISADHKTASFEMRENLYRQRRAIAAFWAQQQPQEGAVLVTCNRIEIYALASSLPEMQKKIGLFYERFPGFLENSVVVYDYQNIFMHLLRVASGLESQLQGELQIFEQLQAWQKQGGFVPALKELICSALDQSRQVRSRCGLNVSIFNLASIVYADIERHLGNAARYSIVILGTGKIAELFSNLRPQNALLYFAAHRNYSKAQQLAQKAGGKAISLNEIINIGAAVDVLIGATASSHSVLSLEDVSSIIKLRRKPLYVYDLAIPRDIEPRCVQLPGVILQNLDTLNRLFEEVSSRIKDKIGLAEYLCGEKIFAQQESLYV